jgi:hypothetical protein
MKIKLGRRKRHGRKRRKQKLRRAQSGTAITEPSLKVPDTARKRRRRNNGLVSRPLVSLRSILASARWVSLLVLLLCAGALALIGMNEAFYLTTIPVDGIASIPAAEVVEASGLAGRHIFGVDPVASARNIAEKPGIISATVRLEWPNHAAIRITEDSPVAVWEQDRRQFWVNEMGRLVPARVNMPGLLRIQAADSEPVSPVKVASKATQGPLLFVPEEVLAGALQLHQLRPTLLLLDYDAAAGLSFEDERGWRVYVGTGEDMAQKLVVYEAIVSQLLQRDEKPLYVSVSNQEKPFYRSQENDGS